MTTKYGVGQVYDGMAQIEFVMPNEDWANELCLVLNRLYLEMNNLQSIWNKIIRSNIFIMTTDMLYGQSTVTTKKTIQKNQPFRA